MMTIVFDTNIYIAAFLNRGFLYYLILKTLDIKNGHTVCYSNATIKELEEKLKQEATAEEVDKFISFLEQFAHRVEPIEKLDIVKADSDDNKILECAVAAEADLIVTMDKHLLKLKQFRGMGIVHPKDLSYMFPKE